MFNYLYNYLFSFFRIAFLEFQINLSGEIHGLLGYFHSYLSPSVSLSILPLPSNHNISPSLTYDSSDISASWFPIYFPFHSPIYLNKDERIKIKIERKIDDKKVWYEWILLNNNNEYIHNYNGKFYSIGI